MAMRDAINSREFDKFVEIAGETAVRVGLAKGQVGTLLQGVVYDYIDFSYPTASSEVYTFIDGGPTGTITASILVQYTGPSKADIDYVWRTL